jgi:hypothetical protein
MAARRALLAVGGVGAAGVAAYFTPDSELHARATTPHAWDDAQAAPAPRAAQLARLHAGKFDVLVIGGVSRPAPALCRLEPRTDSCSALGYNVRPPGGATGTGAALDAATRGLRTALVEADDFASGTSSRSTKLIHGGVRYLEKAVFQAREGRAP